MGQFAKLGSSTGYGTGTCSDLAGERAGARNKCIADYLGVPYAGEGFPAVAGCIDKCTDDACNAACGAAFQDCCYTFAQANSQIYLTECLAACPPEDKCAGKTCLSRCVGNTNYHGYCDSATGNCLEEEGFCANGCLDNKCRATTPDTGYKEKDKLCEFVKGENCHNSPDDCICIAGWKCNITGPDRNDVGCVQVSSFSCNDGTCETSKGENCGSCGGSNGDCVCGAGKRCDANNASADTWGCVYTTKTGEDPCANVQCNNYCGSDISKETGELTEYAANGQCVAGECNYGRVECPQYCQHMVSGQARCTDASPVEAQPNCQVAGVIYGVTGKSALQRVGENGDVVARTVKNGDTYCKGDRVLTINSKVFIASKDGTVTYIAPYSSYKESEYQPNFGLPGDADYIKITGTVQIKQKVKKAYVLGPSNTVGLYEGKSLIDENKLEKERQGQELPEGYGTYWQHYYKDPGSNVIYEFNADGAEKVTVLEGPDVQVIDPGTKQSVSVPAGKQYANTLTGNLGAGTSSNVDISGISDEIGKNPPPETTPSGLCGASAILLLIPALFVLSRKIS